MAAFLRALVVAVSGLAAIFELGMAANHAVTWDLTTNYAQWTTGKTFAIGDTVTFSYASGQHDVSEVSSSDYSACSSSKTLSSGTGGSTVITLKTAGKRYFICGIPGHCKSGMKLAINVVAASSPTPAPSPSPATVPSPSPLSPAAAQAPFSPAAAPPPESDSSSVHTDSPPTPSGATKVTFGFSLGMVMMMMILAL